MNVAAILVHLAGGRGMVLDKHFSGHHGRGLGGPLGFGDRCGLR